jgi:hypothetical protein
VSVPFWGVWKTERRGRGRKGVREDATVLYSICFGCILVFPSFLQKLNNFSFVSGNRKADQSILYGLYPWV